jgi:hypothetical protein
VVKILSPSSSLPRRANSILCAASLLVFFLSVTLWVRSYFVGEWIRRVNYWTDATAESDVTHALYYGVSWNWGTVTLRRFSAGYASRALAGITWSHSNFKPGREPPFPRSPSDRINVAFGDFQLYYIVVPLNKGWASQQYLAFPLWVFLPAGIPPLLWWRRWRRKQGRGFPVEMKQPSAPPEVRAAAGESAG